MTMTLPPKVTTILILAAVGALACASQADVVIADGDFVNWSVNSMESTGCHTTTSVELSGGNPGARIRCQMYATPSGAVWTFWLNDDSLWTPAVDGLITELTMSIETKADYSSGQGQSLAGLVKQDGKYYRASGGAGPTGTSSTWHALSYGPCSESDFVRAVGPLIWDLNDHPDFSVGGSPLVFGFALGNNWTNITNDHSYDNWSVTIVPEPTTLVLLSLGGLALTRRQQWKR